MPPEAYLVAEKKKVNVASEKKLGSGVSHLHSISIIICATDPSCERQRPPTRCPWKINVVLTAAAMQVSVLLGFSLNTQVL